MEHVTLSQRPFMKKCQLDKQELVQHIRHIINALYRMQIILGRKLKCPKSEDPVLSITIALDVSRDAK